MKIQLEEKPFYLDRESIRQVHEIVTNMSQEEKIGQLFVPINYLENEDELCAFVRKYRPAGLMNRPAPAEVNRKKHQLMQSVSEIPMFIPANLESGGNGIAIEGTAYGNPLQVAATGNPESAYELGKIAGAEGRAVGVNYAFAPIIDIDKNTLNPITNTRTFGSQPETVYQMAAAYIRGLMEDGKDMCYSIKHFPGDGIDSRDQHLHTTYNTLSVREWEDTFGWNYRRLIEEGAPTVMVGHIGLPEYVKEINPQAGTNELLCPASLSKDIVTGLLRERMGFNGVVITDSTSMNGFYAHMSRKLAVPTAIANGCDLFLFNFSVEEDYRYMEEGLKQGILTEERLDEAVTRTIALKMSMGLFEKQKLGTLVPELANLRMVGNEVHRKMARNCADQAVTLVKDEVHNLPLSLEKHFNLLVYVMGDREDFYGNSKVGSLMIQRLKEEGFRVTEFDYSRKFPGEKETMEDFFQKYNAVLYILNEGTSSNQTTVRLTWNLPLANDAPWFVNDLPVIAVSFANPYHLRDIPQIRTYINAYTTSQDVVEAVVQKLLGRSPFQGKNPVDTTCGCYELQGRETI